MTSVERICQTAFLRGRVLHAGTEEPIDGTITVDIEEGPSIQHLLDDGTFVLSGRPQELFPYLNIRSYDVHLKIRAMSKTFRAGYSVYEGTVNIPAGQELDPSQYDPVDPLPDAGTIFLNADPVTVRVRVLDAFQNNDPLSGVTVTVVADSFSGGPTTIIDNVYEFSNLPSVAVIAVSCSKDTYHSVTNRLYRVDYTRDIQAIIIALSKA
jgi:hypothetical protein